jgi:hypothetical protein
MKNFILGFFCSILVCMGFGQLWLITENKSVSKLSFFIVDQVYQGNYLGFPFTGRCSNSKNIKGIISADYFGCDNFQRLINIDGPKD